jgi:aspartyl protease family protein
MIVVAWLIVLAMLYVFFREVLEQQYNPNRDLVSTVGPQRSAQVTLQRNRAGHYLARGKINGKEVTLFIDTGASDVAVPGALAAGLGLERGRKVLRHTANGLATGWSTRLASVAVGGIQLEDVKATIMPRMKGEEILLGMSFLKNLELIQRDDQLVLRYPQRG